MEQYLQQLIKKGTGNLEEIFIDARSVKHDWVFHLYTAGTLGQNIA